MISPLLMTIQSDNISQSVSLLWTFLILYGLPYVSTYIDPSLATSVPSPYFSSFDSSFWLGSRKPLLRLHHFYDVSFNFNVSNSFIIIYIPVYTYSVIFVKEMSKEMTIGSPRWSGDLVLPSKRYRLAPKASISPIN